VGLDGIYSRALTELAEELTKPFSIIHHQSWLKGEVPVVWRLDNVTPIYKKGQNENSGNYKPVSLTEVPGKIMEWFILSALTRHVQDNQGISPSQHGFMKGRSCLTNLISFRLEFLSFDLILFNLYFFLNVKHNLNCKHWARLGYMNKFKQYLEPGKPAKQSEQKDNT